MCDKVNIAPTARLKWTGPQTPSEKAIMKVVNHNAEVLDDIKEYLTELCARVKAVKAFSDTLVHVNERLGAAEEDQKDLLGALEGIDAIFRRRMKENNEKFHKRLVALEDNAHTPTPICETCGHHSMANSPLLGLICKEGKLSECGSNVKGYPYWIPMSPKPGTREKWLRVEVSPDGSYVSVRRVNAIPLAIQAKYIHEADLLDVQIRVGK